MSFQLNSMVIAVVGMPGSGKSFAVDHLVDLTGGELVYFGGVVIEEIERRKLEINEINEKRIRMQLRDEYGMQAMAVKRLPVIKSILKNGRTVVIDGIYSYSEYKFLRPIFKSNLCVIALHSSFSIRVQRVLHRPRRPLNLGEIIERDRMEIEEMEKGGPIALADFHIVNEVSINELFEELEKIVTVRLPDHCRTLEELHYADEV